MLIYHMTACPEKQSSTCKQEHKMTDSCTSAIQNEYYLELIFLKYIYIHI